MGLDETILALQVLAPIAGALPKVGEPLKSAVEAATKICEIARVSCGHCLA
jgi:hypothetical protein